MQEVVNICKKCETKNMKTYHNLYLKCDVLLLAHAFKHIYIIYLYIYKYIYIYLILRKTCFCY